LLLISVTIYFFIHLGRDPDPPADLASGGCPEYTSTGPSPSVKPMNPGIPDHKEGTLRSVRLVIPPESYAKLGFDLKPQISFPYNPETGQTWEAAPASESELTVCAYVTKKGPVEQGCSYYWVPLQGVPTPTEDPPVADVFESQILFRVYDTKTGALRGTFTLHGENLECPQEPAGDVIPGTPDDNAIRDRVAQYR